MERFSQAEGAYAMDEHIDALTTLDRGGAIPRQYLVRAARLLGMLATAIVLLAACQSDTSPTGTAATSAPTAAVAPTSPPSAVAPTSPPPTVAPPAAQP